MFICLYIAATHACWEGVLVSLLSGFAGATAGWLLAVATGKPRHAWLRWSLYCLVALPLAGSWLGFAMDPMGTKVFQDDCFFKPTLHLFCGAAIAAFFATFLTVPWLLPCRQRAWRLGTAAKWFVLAGALMLLTLVGLHLRVGWALANFIRLAQQPVDAEPASRRDQGDDDLSMARSAENLLRLLGHDEPRVHFAWDPSWDAPLAASEDLIDAIQHASARLSPSTLAESSDESESPPADFLDLLRVGARVNEVKCAAHLLRMAAHQSVMRGDLEGFQRTMIALRDMHRQFAVRADHSSVVIQAWLIMEQRAALEWLNSRREIDGDFVELWFKEISIAADQAREPGFLAQALRGSSSRALQWIAAGRPDSHPALPKQAWIRGFWERALVDIDGVSHFRRGQTLFLEKMDAGSSFEAAVHSMTDAGISIPAITMIRTCFDPIRESWEVLRIQPAVDHALKSALRSRADSGQYPDKLSSLSWPQDLPIAPTELAYLNTGDGCILDAYPLGGGCICLGNAYRIRTAGLQSEFDQWREERHADSAAREAAERSLLSAIHSQDAETSPRPPFDP